LEKTGLTPDSHRSQTGDTYTSGRALVKPFPNDTLFNLFVVPKNKYTKTIRSSPNNYTIYLNKLSEW